MAIGKSTSFDKIPNLYKEVRAEYPIELYQEIINHYNFSEQSEILEIGAGEGKATQQIYSFLKTKIIAIEPGKQLFSALLQRFSTNPTINVLNVSFENFETEKLFDCIISATAFHWVDSKIKYTKAAQLLKPEGILALYWTNYSRNDNKIFDEIQKIYQQFYPEKIDSDDIRNKQRIIIDTRKNELIESKYFKLVSYKEYMFLKIYSTENYIKLLKTFSNNLIKAEESLIQFYKEIGNIINYNGGSIEVPILVNLEIAKKKN